MNLRRHFLLRSLFTAAAAFALLSGRDAAAAPSTLTGTGWCRGRSTPGVLVASKTASLSWQSDGNLVLYGSDGSAYWASGTANTGQDICFQSDGNLVVRDSSGATRWSSGTAQTGAHTLAVDVCSFSLNDWDSRIWTRGCPKTSLSHGAGWCRSTGNAGELLVNDNLSLRWQGDGNLVLYNTSGTPLWNSETNNTGQNLCFQGDGNLVIHGANGPLWSSDTAGLSTRLTLDDGGFAVVDSSGHEHLRVGMGLYYGPYEISSLRKGWCRGAESFGNIVKSGGSSLMWWAGVLQLLDDTGGLSWTPGYFEADWSRKICFKEDGDFVLLAGDGSTLWSSGTANTGASTLVLDGKSLSITDGTSTLWTQAIDASTKSSLSNNGGWCRTKANPMVLLFDDDASLVWQSDGNLVIYDSNGSAKWASNTSSTGQDLCFQSDGNLVIYDSARSPKWASNTSGTGATILKLDQGGVSISDSGANDTEYWRQGTQLASATTLSKGWCRGLGASGTILQSGGSALTWKGNGDLVFTDSSNNTLWSVPTSGRGTKLCHKKSDGKLVIYKSTGAVEWESSVGADTLALVNCTVSLVDSASLTSVWTRGGSSSCFSTFTGGGFSYTLNKSFGNSRFGSRFWLASVGTNSSSLSSARLAVASNAYLADHLSASNLGSVPSTFADVAGDAGISVTLFDSTQEVLATRGYVMNKSGLSTRFSLVSLGTTLYESTGSISPDPFEREFFRASSSFSIGPVPITCEASAVGSVSFSGTVTGTSPLKIDLAPNANVTGSLSAGVGVSSFSAGVSGELTLIDLNTPTTLSLSTSKSYSVKTDLDLSTLAGTVKLYANALLWSSSKKIASWKGYSTSMQLFSKSGSL